MREAFARLGVEAELFDGIVVDPPFDRIPAYDYAKRTRIFDRPLTRGEIGCVLSHRALWMKLAQSEHEYGCIFEDDVLFEDDFVEVVNALLQNARRFDIVRFMRLDDSAPFKIIAPLTATRSLVAFPQRQPKGAQGYLLSRRAAAVLARHAEKIYINADDLIDRDFQLGLRVLAVNPDVIHHDWGQPTLLGARKPTGAFRPLQKIRHNLYTGKLSLARRIHRLRTRGSY